MILRADNIQKIYGARKVVKGISLEVKQGEIIGLLGPNGAGKTTSFYMIVGMVKPNEGKIFLNDEEITKEEFLNHKPRKYQLTEEEKDLITLCATEYNASTEERIILGKLMRKLWTK